MSVIQFSDRLNDAFKESFLLYCSDSKQNRALFKCGTVVDIEVTNDSFSGFRSDKYDLPEHRFQTDDYMQTVLNENQEIYENTIKKHEKYVKFINSAYITLIDDGYPYPGGDGADRIVESFTDLIMKITFVNRSKKIRNLFPIIMENSSYTIKDIDSVGAEMRRFDHMQPVLLSLWIDGKNVMIN